MKTIFEDDREIKWVNDNLAQRSWLVGHENITKIVPYQENGQMAHVTWLAIYTGNDIAIRMDAAGKEIGY